MSHVPAVELPACIQDYDMKKSLLKFYHQGYEGQLHFCIINVEIDLGIYSFIIILSSPSLGQHVDF